MKLPEDEALLFSVQPPFTDEQLRLLIQDHEPGPPAFYVPPPPVRLHPSLEGSKFAPDWPHEEAA